MDKKETMFLLVDQWRKSGLSRKIFAQQHGITDSSFEYWCRKRDNKIKNRPAIAPDFVEIFQNSESKPKTFEQAPQTKVEIELPGGIRIKFY
jgi:hypothetical protein